MNTSSIFLCVALRAWERSGWPCVLQKPVRSSPLTDCLTHPIHTISPPQRIIVCNNIPYIQFRLHLLPQAFWVACIIFHSLVPCRAKPFSMRQSANYILHASQCGAFTHRKRILESADEQNYTHLHLLLYQGCEMEAVAIICFYYRRRQLGLSVLLPRRTTLVKSAEQRRRNAHLSWNKCTVKKKQFHKLNYR